MNFLLKTLSFTLISLTSFSLTAETKYPDSWWKEVPAKEAKSWEILPQEAGPGEVILSKRTELGVFSNLAESPFTYDGERYASIEALWQMMKYPEGKSDPRFHKDIVWPHTRDEVKNLAGFESKSAGKEANKNMKALGIKWVSYNGKRFNYKKGEGQSYHYEIIYAATYNKIVQNPELKKLLLKTKGLKLKPDHSQGKNPPPSYKYHEILMKIRGDI